MLFNSAISFYNPDVTYSGLRNFYSDIFSLFLAASRWCVHQEAEIKRIQFVTF